jgi:hypothetical protein
VDAVAATHRELWKRHEGEDATLLSMGEGGKEKMAREEHRRADPPPGMMESGA